MTPKEHWRWRRAAKALLPGLVCWALVGCATFDPVGERLMAEANALDVADGEVEFDLVERAGLSAQQIEAKELQMAPGIDAQCTAPAYERYFAAQQQAFQGPPLAIGWSLRSVAFLADELELKLRACIQRAGAVGNAFVITADGRRMSLPDHARAVHRAAFDLMGHRIATSTPFVWEPRYGCGSRGGPGYRLANGQCAGWAR